MEGGGCGSGSLPNSRGRRKIYLDLALIFRLFRFSLRIRFFRHFARILSYREIELSERLRTNLLQRKEDGQCKTRSRGQSASSSSKSSQHITCKKKIIYHSELATFVSNRQTRMSGSLNHNLHVLLESGLKVSSVKSQQERIP